MAGMILLWVAGVVGLRIGFDWDQGRPANQTEIAADARKNVPKAGKADGGEKLEDFGGSQVGKTVTSGSQRQPLQFRAKAMEPAAMLAVLATGKQTVEERVRQLQRLRGISLSKEERESALAFLAGNGVPEGMGKGSMQWLADELLTVLRLQQPPWEGLAGELSKVAFQPGTVSISSKALRKLLVTETYSQSLFETNKSSQSILTENRKCN